VHCIAWNENNASQNIIINPIIAEQKTKCTNLKRNVLSREARAVEVGEVNAAKHEIGQYNAADRVRGNAARAKTEGANAKMDERDSAQCSLSSVAMHGGKQRERDSSHATQNKALHGIATRFDVLATAIHAPTQNGGKDDGAKHELLAQRRDKDHVD
jgi:hypothetical protein